MFSVKRIAVRTLPFTKTRMRVVLTGASGMLASALRVCAPEGVDLIALSRAELDIGDGAQVEQQVATLRPDVLLNAAAYTEVDRAESHSEVAARVNGLAPGLLGKAAARWSAKVVHFSTDYVFDGLAESAYGEAAATNPINVYGRTKLNGEIALRDSGARHLIIRTQWLYGPAGRSFPATMWMRACKGVPTRVIDDQTGVPTFTEDLARATWRLLERDGILNVVNEGSTSWHGVAQRIFSAAGCAHLLSACTSDERPTPARRPVHSRLSTARLRALGETLPPWTDALDRYIARLSADAECGR